MLTLLVIPKQIKAVKEMSNLKAISILTSPKRKDQYIYGDVNLTSWKGKKWPLRIELTSICDFFPSLKFLFYFIIFFLKSRWWLKVTIYGHIDQTWDKL